MLTGASAGGFGATSNYDQAQDGFGHTSVVLLDDSGPLVSDQFDAPCLQKLLRDLWGINAALPTDCADCFHADGGGLGYGAAGYFKDKYPDAKVGVVSSLEDEVLRFLRVGRKWLPRSGLSRAQVYPGSRRSARPRRPGPGSTGHLRLARGHRHTHIFRDRFYTQMVGGVTMAQWVADLLAGKPSHVSPRESPHP